MCAPATAALFLAALSALPCRGSDADVSTTANTKLEKKSLPILNKVYRMLHSTTLEPVYNFTNLDFTDFDTKPCCQTKEMDTKGRKRRVVNINRINENVTFNMESTTAYSPISLERRRRPGETGSSAPLLNYIFDTYSNSHQHRNERPGNGNSIYVATGPEIEALVGSTAQLDCKVDALHDKLVSWVRRKNDEEPMKLLTTGTQLYTADDRYSARFIPPDIWRLEVRQVRPSDEAYYDCQLSAHPPRTARVTLRVPEVSVRIVDGAGAEVSEQVCEVGSTVALRCEVRGLRMEGGPSLLWYRRDLLLNDDTTRGGISVRTEFGSNGANSVLRVARVRADDAGLYSCTVARAPPPAPPPAQVTLHIIKGESLAELHQGAESTSTSKWLLLIPAIHLILHTLL
ncbi:vascular endothelial growth factor receptor 3-like [Aricia agestis]|uniref:vascular endothelial growth factor receptor 3-like n=1 Tax=Aricia agestis TaxID=91739 RepID=UPI001C207EFF|nr:vascular endothelial growth factor receptor 3-like [Aricia agestis]